MLVWSTILPLKPTTTLDKICGVFKLWLEGSPHSRFRIEKVLPDVVPEGESEFFAGDERVLAYRLPSALGFQYLRKEDDIMWRTECAFFPQDKIVATYIRIFSDMNGLSYKKPDVKTPYIVKQLVKICGCEDDGPFPCTPRTVQMKFTHVSALAELVRGNVRTLLPVVYIRPSLEWKNVHYQLFEKWIGARAHIVCSPGVTFDQAVAKTVSHPPYPLGSITVFIPQAKHPMTLPRYRYESLSRQMASAALLVRDATLRATGSLGPGLDAIRNACSHREYAKLRDEFIRKDSANRDFVEYADKEVASKERRIKELEGQVEYLNAQVSRYSARKCSQSGVEVLFELDGVEPYYTEELHDAILHTLTRGVSSLNEKGRYATLIQGVLKGNLKSDFEKRLDKALRDVLVGNKNVQRGDLAALEKLGFQYIDGSKHHQLSFMGDEKLMCTISKTPSDHRSAQNCISEILKKLFK